MAENKENLVASETRNEKLDTRIIENGVADVRETYARVPTEVKTWMRKVEEDPGDMKTVMDDGGQPVLQPATSQNPKIQLPTTRNKFVAGFKKKIDEAGRWLSTFLFKLIKKNDGKVKFKEE